MSKMKFGKYRDEDVEDVPDSYFQWLLDQDWFLDKNPLQADEILKELEYREKWNRHVTD